MPDVRAESPAAPDLARIRLLGGFAAWHADGTPVSGLGRRTMALLACLAMQDTPWARDDLAALLWPGRSLDQMRGSLRQELLRLRRAFGWSATGNGASLGLPPGQAEVDVVRLRQALDHPAPGAEVVALYRGPLLQGFRTDAREPFARWLARERDRLHAAALDAMLRLLRSAEGSDRLARRILVLAPACEEAHRTLMRQHAAEGEFGQVLAQFRACAEALRQADGAEPSAETRALLDTATAALGARPAGPAAPASALAWIRAAPDRAPVPGLPEPRALPIVEDRPSVAVLPLQDLSHDPLASGVLADGMTEEVTNALARMPGFFVTARHSALAYRGLGMDARRIAAELGVRYLVEGSVEQDGRRMRANVRLIDGSSGQHLWADSQGGPMRDVMAVRDAVVHRLASRLQPRLMLAEIQRAVQRPPHDLDAWTWLQRANAILLRGRSRQALDQAQEPLRRALEADPHYAMAHALLAALHTWRTLSLHTEDPAAERALAREHAAAALGADPENPFVLVHCAEAAIYGAADIDRGLSLLEYATERDPNDAHGQALLGHARRFAGEDPTVSLRLIDAALRLSPRDPRTYNWHHYANWCHWRLEDFPSMEAASRRSIELYGQHSVSWIALTGALALQDRMDEAREAAAVLRRQRPGFTPDGFFEVSRHFYGRRFPGEVERAYDRLRQSMRRVW